jgi:anti-sigma factor (TIGR02949 family)
MFMTDKELRCEEVIAHLFSYLDGEMDAARRAEIDGHLQACRGCYSRAEFEKALQAKVRDLGEKEAPENLRQRLKTLLDQF